MPRRGGGGGAGAAIDERCEALGAAAWVVADGCARLQPLPAPRPHNKTNQTQAAG
jgi:hypothetical protein